MLRDLAREEQQNLGDTRSARGVDMKRARIAAAQEAKNAADAAAANAARLLAREQSR